MNRLSGKRILVVGASRGLGRAFAAGLLAEGARIVGAARSQWDLTDEVDAQFVTCDVRDPVSCTDAVADACARLGGIDALVYAPGMTVVTELGAATSEHWRTVMETNVIGASLVTTAAMSELEKSAGIAVYFSSVSAHVTPPWVGMGLYAASKVALEKMAEVWKLEHPNVRITTMVVGSTSDTSFFADAEKPDQHALKRFREEWQARGYLAQQQLSPADQTEALIGVLTSQAQMDTVWVRPRTLLQLWPDGTS